MDAGRGRLFTGGGHLSGGGETPDLRRTNTILTLFSSSSFRCSVNQIENFRNPGFSRVFHCSEEYTLSVHSFSPCTSVEKPVDNVDNCPGKHPLIFLFFRIYVNRCSVAFSFFSVTNCHSNPGFRPKGASTQCSVSGR